MQDNDKQDQANTQDSDMPQIIGGPSIFADENEHVTDQPQTEGATLTASMQGDQSEQSAETQSSSGDELIEILSGVEKQIERLRGLHLTHEKKLNSIAQRSRALEDAELSFDSDSSSLKQREEELEEKASGLEALQLKLTDQQTEIEQERQSLEQEQAELAKQQKAVEIEFESLKEQRAVIEQHEEASADEEHQQHQQHQQQEYSAARHAEIEQAQLDIKREREEFNKEREIFCQERDALAKLLLENEGQDISFQEREVEFQQKQIELDQKQQSYTAQLRELEQEREGLKNETDALQALRLENEDQTASSQEREVEFQQKQIELDQKQQSHTALQRELEQERESLLSEKKNFDLKQAELYKQCSEYESRQNEFQQQQEQIEQLKTELADIRIKADPDLMQRKDERIEELVEALHQARGQIGGEQSIDKSEARIQQLLSENELLRIQLERSSIDTTNDKQTSEALTDAISTTAPADESGPVDQEIQALQDQVQLLHIQSDVQDSQNENDELEKIPNIQAPGNSNELEFVDLDEEDTFRGTNPLSHPSVQAPVENPVIVPPQNYIKRKTGPVKIITTLGWLTVASVIIAGASWLAADHYFPATVSASVSFKAGSQSNSALTSEQKQLWQDWHTNMLTDVDFTSMLSNRLAARRLDQYADVNTLRIYLAENLAVDLAQPDTITLTLAGTDKNELAALLDTLATTFISQSDESLMDNGDGLKTLALGARRQGNQVLYASLNSTPILDERIKYASYMFAVGFGGAVILVTLISRRPVRPTDMFADSDPVFVTPQG